MPVSAVRRPEPVHRREVNNGGDVPIEPWLPHIALKHLHAGRSG